MDFQEAIEFVLTLPDGERFNTGSSARSMPLSTMKAVLEKLGHPECGRGTVHVTGSKGKGSTSTFVNALLHASGFSTALYTSPHLESYTERICLNLTPVSESDFAATAAAIKDVVEQEHEQNGPVSTFGALTAMFFELARARGTQWQIVEVGLGGRLDATNVFTRKDVAVITAISLEHTAFLGRTPEEIAEQKSGIITPGCAVVVAPQRHAGALAVVKQYAQEVGVQFVDVATEYQTELLECTADGQTFRVSGPRGTYELATGMRGRHQLDNAATAIAAAENALAAKLPQDVAAEAFRRAVIGGRMELMRRTPLTLIDGAHNPDSARVLAQALRDHFPGKRVILVLGMNADKDVEGFLEAFLPHPAHVIATASNNLKAMAATLVSDAARSCGVSSETQPSVQAALASALAQSDADSLICVTGSLYVAGEARTLLLSATSGHLA